MLNLTHWPAQARRNTIGVFTDIDDTLTTDGVITPDALRALADLHAAGLHVIPITGRPVGWSEPFARAWPVDALVAENGAVAWVRQLPRGPSEGRGPLARLYQQDAATRSANTAAMQRIAEQIERALPGVRRSQDSAGRETDLAFDYAEHTQLSPDTVQQVLARLQGAGMHTTVSSIHVHGCFSAVDKWQGAQWIVRSLWGRDLSAEIDRWVFVGDSGNDQAMFRHFTHSVGVANIAHFLPALTHRPRYITAGERGAGFAQVAAAVLADRAR